jgi:hypothetical protein
MEYPAGAVRQVEPLKKTDGCKPHQMVRICRPLDLKPLDKFLFLAGDHTFANDVRLTIKRSRASHLL